MTYIIHPAVFYLVGLITKANAAFEFLMLGFAGMGLILAFINFLTCDDFDDFKIRFKEWKIKTLLTFGIVFMTINIFIPQPKTAYYMLAATVVTQENIKGVTENATEIITNLVEGISEALGDNVEE